MPLGNTLPSVWNTYLPLPPTDPMLASLFSSTYPLGLRSNITSSSWLMFTDRQSQNEIRYPCYIFCVSSILLIPRTEPGCIIDTQPIIVWVSEKFSNMGNVRTSRYVELWRLWEGKTMTAILESNLVQFTIHKTYDLIILPLCYMYILKTFSSRVIKVHVLSCSL